MNVNLGRDEKSSGHVCFFGRCELYVREGHLLQAPRTNVVRASGFRDGRWICSTGVRAVEHVRFVESVAGDLDVEFTEVNWSVLEG